MNGVNAAQCNGRELEKALQELEVARGQVAETKEKYLRVLADQENYRKRLQKVFEERLEQDKERLLSKFLRVADDLERALSYAKPDDPLSVGVKLTLASFLDVLAEEGVEPLDDATNVRFDPALHEAVGVAPGGNGQAEVVDSVVRRGYRYQGKLLRPAAVTVRAGA